MVSTGDAAPTFTATVGTSDHESFDLDDHIGDGPVVLAFFLARSRPLHERDGGVSGARRRVRGRRRDAARRQRRFPVLAGAFREKHGIEFDLVSDTGRRRDPSVRAGDRHRRPRPLRSRQSGGVRRSTTTARSSTTGSPTTRRTSRTTTPSSTRSRARRAYSVDILYK